MKEIKVRLTFTEDMLGTASSNPELHEEFIASKAPDAKSREEEVAAIGVDGVIEKATTIFPKMEDGTPFIWDYMIRGFFKEACSVLKKVKGTKSAGLKAFKKEVDGLIFVTPRQIPLDLHGMKLGNCQRPLRADSPQGAHTALANSEVAPAGTQIEFTVQLLNEDDEALVREWLDYGKFKGLGQWRNSGKGRFEVEYLD